MATAEDRRVRLQGYADAKTLDRALRAEGGQGGRFARLLHRVRIGGRGRRRPVSEA
jgi:hypothetical protein